MTRSSKSENRFSKEWQEERGEQFNKLTAEHGVFIRPIRGIGKGAVMVSITHFARHQTQGGSHALEVGVHALLWTY